jgi:integrase/recombinase XerD
MPCNHNLEAYLDAYINAAGLAGDLKGYLFRTVRGRGRALTTNPMAQADVYRMIRRRAFAAGIKTRIGNHTFRATGITQYLRNGGRRSLRSRWLRMNRRGRRRYTIGGMMRWPWTRWRGF